MESLRLSPEAPDSRNMFYTVFITAVLFYCWNGLYSDGFNGDADSITHYQIARYSWKYPELLLDQWGKPLFTILSSPFAQIGFKAVVFFNILLIFWAGWLSWLIARRLQIMNSWLVPFFVLFSPVVMGNGVSALTEMVCALFLILYIYLFLKKKEWLATLLVSFMPFARSEGFVVLAVLFLFYIFTRRWKMIPVLVTGSVVFNLAGYLATGNSTWIFANNPYINTAINVYGSGSFFHFFIYAIPVFGVAFLFAIYTTVVKVSLLGGLVTGKNKSENDAFWVWVIMGTTWGYFAAHTFLWWQGMWASLGLTRVMAVIMVPMALLATAGLNSIMHKLNSSAARKILLYSVMVVSVIVPFIVSTFPVPLGPEEREHLRAVAFLQKDENLYRSKIFAANPYMPLALKRDPYDRKSYQRIAEYSHAATGDIIIWDAHFAPNEEQVPLTTLTHDSSLVIIGHWVPIRPFKALNNYDFEIYAFRKR